MRKITDATRSVDIPIFGAASYRFTFNFWRCTNCDSVSSLQTLDFGRFCTWYLKHQSINDITREDSGSGKAEWKELVSGLEQCKSKHFIQSLNLNHLWYLFCDYLQKSGAEMSMLLCSRQVICLLDCMKSDIDTNKSTMYLMQYILNLNSQHEDADACIVLYVKHV